MPKKSSAKSSKSSASAATASAFQPRKKQATGREQSDVHVYGKGIVCDTETRGHARPQGRSILEIIVDASEGFIPLWAKDQTLRWKFRESSLKFFEKPAAAKTAIRKLLGEALLAWGDAAPVKFAERNDVWDFEIIMRATDNCNAVGCVLASAFFPDAGRHKLTLYPRMFTQDHQEQLETLVHEIGHAFGLRHFFAKIQEAQFASEIFGKHDAFSIMNYGPKSKLTDADKSDLKKLYQAAWKGELKEINGTPIKFMKPYHTAVGSPDNLVAMPAAPQPIPMAAFVTPG